VDILSLTDADFTKRYLDFCQVSIKDPSQVLDLLKKVHVDVSSATLQTVMHACDSFSEQLKLVPKSTMALCTPSQIRDAFLQSLFGSEEIRNRKVDYLKCRTWHDTTQVMITRASENSAGTAFTPFTRLKEFDDKRKSNKDRDGEDERTKDKSTHDRKGRETDKGGGSVSKSDAPDMRLPAEVKYKKKFEELAEKEGIDKPKHAFAPSCCANGAVVLPPWRVPPEPLLSLLTHEEFRHHIRAYNTRMSLGSSVFSDQTVRFGPATFKMAGRSWRLLPNAMHPSGSELPKCAQIYTLPAMEATDRRMSLQSSGHSPLRATWLLQLHSMLLQNNALVRSFAHSVSTVRDWQIDIGSLEPHAVAHNDTMVGLLLNGGQDRQTMVIPQHSSGHLVIVPDLDPYYQPLHFVLLFPYGDPQWGLHLLRAKDNRRKRAREGVFVLRAMWVISRHIIIIFHVIIVTIIMSRFRDAIDDCGLSQISHAAQEWSSVYPLFQSVI
jgi:hypothetical protein